MYSSSETISKKILPSNSIKTDINCQLKTPHSSSDLSTQKPSEKDLTASILSSLASKKENLDSTGSTTWVQSLRPIRHVMDMLNF